MTPFSMPTADWRKARSRSPRCKVTSTPRSAWPPYWRGGSGATAMLERLDAEADRLRDRFESAFWCPEIETYALALDGQKQPCRVRTSNAGQVLFTGIASPDRAHLVAKGLLQPYFFSGWGIRTVATGEARYNPMRTTMARSGHTTMR